MYHQVLLCFICFVATVFDFFLFDWYYFSFLFIPDAVSQGTEVPVGDSACMVNVKTTDWKEKAIEAAIGDTKLDQVLFLPQTEREIEDVWFVLLDVPNREELFVPPGMELLVITGLFSCLASVFLQ